MLKTVLLNTVYLNVFTFQDVGWERLREFGYIVWKCQKYLSSPLYNNITYGFCIIAKQLKY